jgi:salicylate hydroxylase
MWVKKVNLGLYILSENWDYDTWVRPAKKGDMQRDADNMGRYVKSLIEV